MLRWWPSARPVRARLPVACGQPKLCLRDVQETCSNHTCTVPQLASEPGYQAFCGADLLSYPVRLSLDGPLPLGQVSQMFVQHARADVCAACA